MYRSAPIFSRCSLGKGRWFWIVFQSWKGMIDGEQPLASGYADTAQEAERAALTVAPDAWHYKANLASFKHRQLCNQRRAARPCSNGTKATVQEFLYRDWMSDWETEWRSIPHLIVKKTKKLIFVNKERYNPDPWDRHTYALNRAELEANGSVWSHSARDRFFTTPYEQRRRPSRESPELTVLGLEAGTSKEDIKRAYRRLAKQHHPDCGGDAEKFKEIQAAFERTMAG